MLPAVPRPWHAAFGQEDIEVRLCRSLAFDQAHLVHVAIWCEPGAIVIGIGDGGRQGNALQIGCERLQTRKRQAEQITALTIGEGMHFIDDDALERREHMHAVFVTEQQRQ